METVSLNDTLMVQTSGQKRVQKHLELAFRLQCDKRTIKVFFAQEKRIARLSVYLEGDLLRIEHRHLQAAGAVQPMR